MAEVQGAWGIDVGQAGLKAVRIRFAEAAGQAIAVAFDYIPYPKILSQPDADPDQLIGEALDTIQNSELPTAFEKSVASTDPLSCQPITAATSGQAVAAIKVRARTWTL